MNMQMKRFASAALVLFAALAAQSSDAVKVACIGDSITYGLGLADRAKESYPAQLKKLLDEFEPGKYEVRNFGNSGRGIYLDSMRGNGEMARLAKCEIYFWDFNDGKWRQLTPENALRKSAFGVSFAIRRAEATGKVIGMLYVAAGSAPTESFLSEQTMCAMGKDGKPLYPHLAAIATNRHRLDQNKDFPCAWVAREYPRRRTNREEACWWPVSLMYDYGIKRIKGGEVQIDGILWYQGESNATTCVAPDKPTYRDYQLETLRAIVSELRSVSQLPTPNSQLL